jgi:hypothetical protein
MTARRPLDPAEAARIEAAYGVKVPEDAVVTRYRSGQGVLWEDRHPRAVAQSKWRAMIRRQRVARAKPWRPE